MPDPKNYKIYSRKRFCLSPKGNSRFKQKIKKITPLCGVVIVAFCTFYLIWRSIDPIFETICKDEAKSIATHITNEESTVVMKRYSYDQFFTIQKDENDKIQMVSANILTINEITSDSALNIQKRLNDTADENIKISLGSATGIKLLAGSGPKVNLKIATVGSVDTDLKSEFIEQSINHTLHRVYLNIECKVNILTPFSTIEDRIYNQVLLAENVIVGEIPNTYYNLEGLEGKNEVLETLE